MKIAILQPCFIPWLGYFEQMAVVDLFVYMDDVQYTKKDWRNVNQLKSPNGVKKIIVPVKKTSRDTLLMNVDISYSSDWQRTMINQIKEWYKKANYYEEVNAIIENGINECHEKLVDLNYELNKQICAYLGINTVVSKTSIVPKKSTDKNARIIEICEYFGADLLFDGASAQSFINQSQFNARGIKVVFQNYKPIKYEQLWNGFEPFMSVIDLMMNHGKDSLNIILENFDYNILKHA